MLACGSLVLIGLSHFLQFTLSFGSRRVLSVIPHAPFCHSHRSANPHKSCRFSRLLRSISLSFTTRADIFSHALFLWLCKETFRKLHVPCFATPHISPFRSFPLISLHRSFHSSPCLFQPARSGKKMRPALLQAAPCHRALRFPCQGHSLHSQWLAHNAQASLLIRFAHFKFSLAIQRTLKAVSPFRFKPASPTPTPDHPPLKVQLIIINPLISSFH